VGFIVNYDLSREQDFVLIRSAIAELSPVCRRVFVMHRFDGIGYADIARRLDLSVATIEQLVSQALTHLKNRLDTANPGIPPQPATLVPASR
jgi:RNA polymerase sigma factor (sigma-70 family)